MASETAVGGRSDAGMPASLQAEKPQFNLGSATAFMSLLALFCCLCLARFDEIHGQAEIENHMAVIRQLHGDWYTHPEGLVTGSPHLYPLCQWAVGSVFGEVNSFTLRLTNLLFTMGVLGVVGWLARGRRALFPVALCALLPVAVGATVIIEGDSAVMPFLMLVLVASVTAWSVAGGGWRGSWWVVLCFGLALWCRLSTPLALMPLLIGWAGMRHGWKGAGGLACWLVLGGLLFHVSWRTYGAYAGVDWRVPYRQAVDVFSMSSGKGGGEVLRRLLISGGEMVLWGLALPFVLLLVHSCRSLIGMWRRMRMVPCWSLYVLSGVWLLLGGCVFGGSQCGFPTYQVCGYPLALLGIWLFGCERWHWDKVEFTRDWRRSWLFLLVAVVAGALVAGDPQLALRVSLREACVAGIGVSIVLGELILRQIGYYFLWGAVAWYVWRCRFKAPGGLLLWMGLGMNVGMLGCQTLATYQRGYLYGDRGDTRNMAAWIVEHGYERERILVPVEVQDVMGDHEIAGKRGFRIHDREAIREEIRQKQPALVSISWLCYPVGDVKAFLDDGDLQALLSTYERQQLGQYLFWRRKN